MPIAEMVSLMPVTELMKLVISKAKKVKDFKPLFKELASTMQRLVPIIQEIDMLQERLDPGNKELHFLTKTVRRAENIVSKCSRVREYDAFKKISYAKIIKGINEDFVKFCQLELPLLQHRNMLRSLSLINMDEHNSNVSTRNEDEQKTIWACFNDKEKLQEDEQLTAALQEILNMEELDSAPQNSTFQQRVILESYKDKGKEKQLQDDEQLSAALQEILNMEELDTASRKSKQRVIWKRCKDKCKGKQLQEDVKLAVALQENLNMEELSLREVEELHSALQKSLFLHREEQVAKRRRDEQIATLLYNERGRITNGSSS